LSDVGLIVVADYSTSVRIFEALREKTENKTQYDAYVNELKPVREELGMSLYIFSPSS
jgi:cytochrome c oxidase subunit 5a